MKRTIAFAFLILCFAGLGAKKIATEEALRIAPALFRHLGGEPKAGFRMQAIPNSEGDDDFYILRFAPEGFVILSSDDRCEPLLAYSVDTAFPAEDIPPNAQWLLGEYSRVMADIRALPEASADPKWQAIRSGDFSAFSRNRDVAPLITTTWNQNYPYNSLCPVDPSGPGGRVYAGCVATAMAQLMKYWGHPITGSGSHGYNAPGYGYLSANFGQTTYNWASMPNAVTMENISVATLIYHCAVSVNTQFGPNGSSAYLSNSEDALETHFRYDPSAQYQTASSYSASVWAAKLRLDLEAGRPILYRGQSSTMGHAWIIDGHQLTNYFHCNWGWGGSANGYFYLNNLNPGSYNLSQSQAAILGLYPLAQGNLQGVVSSGSVALAEAVVSIAGREYITTDNGSYIFTGLMAGSHQIRVSKPGYYTQTNTLIIEANQTTHHNVNLSEPLYPPADLQATLEGDDVLLTWQTPEAPIITEWLGWGDASYAGAYGYGVATSFDVAQRWDQTDLEQYYQGSLNQVRIYPCYAECTYTVKVWSGGSAANPGELVYSEVLSNPILSSWNTVSLAQPIAFPQQGDLWVGYGITTQGGFPIAYDSGPAIDGKGNMFGIAGNWSSMLYYGAQYDFNWLIQALISYTGRSELSVLSHAEDMSRELTGFKLWRFLAENEEDPQSWTLITPSVINGNSHSDPGFSALASGTYKWAVKAVYTSTAMSEAVFSNPLTQGTAPPLSPDLSINRVGEQIWLSWPAIVCDIHGAPLTRVQYRIYAHSEPDFPTTDQYLFGITRDTLFICGSAPDKLFFKVLALSDY
jgi:hypothetical protein